ncbi:MAG: FAD-binding oxidoreductase, partial [Proteobacteria bacterium]|nr:FAD-binding oxidoreductase [Pseudomonadota bacterium]
MQLQPPNIDDVYSHARINNLTQLSNHIMLVELKVEEKIIPHKTGQFINIKTHLDNKIRSYSIVNTYNGNTVAINVQKIKDGIFSNWIFNGAQTEDELLIHYPLGACYASDDMNVQGKLLLATGSGLGATLAIATEALEKGFTQPIVLYHGVKTEDSLYLQHNLAKLSKKFSNFKFVACVSDKTTQNKEIKLGYVNNLAFETLLSLKTWEVYIYGNPIMVKSATLKATELGCREENIFCDAFEYGQSAQSSHYNKSTPETDAMELVEEKKQLFEPDPAMWQALEEGKKLNQILNDFYDKVLTDTQLAPFFKGVTKEHIVGKQYAFLNQIYTGQDCYFGDRPRNAHHWMIISDSLFDHREKLFSDSCIK